MVDRYDQCLMEARKWGYVLRMNPPGERNRCFYECIATFLEMEVTEVLTLIEDYMNSNQFVSVTNEVSRIFILLIVLL